jgi:hypothetical protein
LDGEKAFNSAWWPSLLKKKAGARGIYTTLQKITLAKEKQPWQQTTSP